MTETGVWIVQHDETPHNTILGVFSAQSEAAEYANEIQSQYANGVIYSFYKLGYRHHGDAYIRALKDG